MNKNISLLQLPHCPPGTEEKQWVDIFENLFPDQSDLLAQTPQDPIHHAEGDVWTHTKMVVNELLNHPQYATLSGEEQSVVFTAAMLHDIRKPQTTKIQSDGRITAAGHSRQGATWARQTLWEMGVDRAQREMVSRLISYHQTPFYAFADHSGASAEFLARKISSDCKLSLLSVLAQADMLGRVCADQQNTLDNIALFDQQAQELDCWDKPYAFPDTATRSRYILSHGKRDADTPVFLPEAFEVIVLSGLPASGKDTFCAQYDWPVLSYDDTRAQLGFKHGQGTGAIVHAVHDQARELLRKKQSFIWNATHLSESMRQPALNLIRQYGGSPTIVCLEANKEELLARNTQRSSSLPNSKLLEMVHKWEMPWSWEADAVRHETPAVRPKKAFK